jgi:hypothetical protein
MYGYGKQNRGERGVGRQLQIGPCWSEFLTTRAVSGANSTFKFAVMPTLVSDIVGVRPRGPKRIFCASRHCQRWKAIRVVGKDLVQFGDW